MQQVKQPSKPKELSVGWDGAGPLVGEPWSCSPGPTTTQALTPLLLYSVLLEGSVLAPCRQSPPRLKSFPELH